MKCQKIVEQSLKIKRKKLSTYNSLLNENIFQKDEKKTFSDIRKRKKSTVSMH